MKVYDIHLTVFTAMRKPDLCWRPVSIRSSFTLVHYIHTAEDIVKLLSPPGSPTTLAFLTSALIPNSKGNPFSGGAKCTGREKFAIFDRNRRLPRKRYEIGPWLLLNAYRKSYAVYRIVIFSMTLMDP